MAQHKITMRDIARECGVSAATVSYVLNHSEKEKISHEMRLKVMETATQLHYTLPKNDWSRKSGLFGIITNLKESNTEGKKLLYYDLAAELSEQMRMIGYETLVMTTSDLAHDIGIIAKHRLDAVFMIDADGRSVRKMTQKYYVPILFLECDVEDPLFCCIYPDYTELIEQCKALLGEQHPFLLMEDICNQNLKSRITDWFLTKDIFINTPGADLRSFLERQKGRRGIVFGDLLALQAQSLFPPQDLAVVSSLGRTGLLLPGSPVVGVRNKTKAAVAVEILRNMLSLDYEAEDGNRILLKSEAF